MKGDKWVCPACGAKWTDDGSETLGYGTRCVSKKHDNDGSMFGPLMVEVAPASSASTGGGS